MNFSPQPEKHRIPLWAVLLFCGFGIFFLMAGGVFVWQLNRFEKDMDISVPAAETVDEVEGQVNEMVINIRDDGELMVNNKVITPEKLQQRLRKVVKKNPDQAIVLRGATNTDFESVVSVLDEIKAAGIWNVAFATSNASTLPTKPK